MGDVEPLAIVQCHTCLWWWYLYDQRPTEPFTCTYCKHGRPVWNDIPYKRRPTPGYGRFMNAVKVPGPKKKR